MSPTSPDYLDHVRALQTNAPNLASEVADFHGIGAVIDWMDRKGLDLRAIDMVVQDEFEYDFLLPLAEGGGWLVFGVT